MSSVPASFSGTLQTVTIRGDTPHWSPYPGLRPFQPDDSEYFFGRDAQVDDVVARLRDKRFVAVIGGSGSGKSSLVLAGAIPRLRTYAIKDAGDFWVPVIATPGTNHVEGDSPLRRLAHKFCSELVESSDASTRLEACVTLLRRQDGLGELVERFGGQIKGAGSVDLKLVQVNFLFLVDQFEELFHPSNERSPLAADCQHLVDRIVEQFKKQHPQVCVALTMRSEHLNDCPRYDELPDAINAASYLVKRLNREQLRNAIEQPVQRYHDKYLSEQRSARRQARREGQAQVAAPSISTPIVIEENLIVRLLDDSKAVLAERGHADQLPLLQHLLFWIWYEASERCKDQPLVDALTLDDLWKAVGQSPDNQTRRPDSSINTLEACLQNRCEAIFTDHVIEQKAWQEVFRSLAFKEPNTGTYTQQRASMTELRQRLGIITGDNVELAAHLQPWMKPHGYLHWDQDSGTVKVTHETLIRRWKLFRDWIDEEDRQFRVYLRLLDDCERWKTARVSGGGLSGGDTLRRYEDEQLPVILKDPVRVARINRLLGMDRDGKRLTTVAADAVRFLDLSIESRSKRERERDEVEKAALQSRAAAEKEKAGRVTQRLWLLLLAVVVILLLPLTIWVKTLAEAEKQLANKERALNRSYALAVETLVGFQPQFRDLAGPQGLLRYSLIGSHFLDDGRQLTTSPAHWPLINRYYETRLKALRTTERFSEARNTESLRTILQGAVWAVPGKVNSLGRTGHQQCKAYQFALN